MLRKSLLLMTAIAAFTMNVSAVQIEVPAGQPPIPGSDANIPANAYENYRAGSLSNVGASDVIKLHSESKKRMDMYVTDWGLTRDEVNQIEQIAYYLRLERSDYESIKAMFTIANGSRYQQQNTQRNTPDAYNILGISRNATDAEVKQAYRNMAKKYHPDKVITDDEAIKKGAEEKFKQVQQAYEQIANERGMNR